MERLFRRIAEEIGARTSQVEAAVVLLDEGGTVPFISRYRKEATGGLDDTRLRTLQERLRYLRELEERRVVILRTISEQGKLTPELAAAVQAAETKVSLEDLYLPYKPKRRTKAQTARQAGLEPLAHALLADPDLSPEEQAAAYVSEEKRVPDAAAALEGARQILMEEFAEIPELVGAAREYLWENGQLQSRVAEGKEEQGVKYADYFNVDQPIKNIPSHRALALFRGRREGFLKLSLAVPQLDPQQNDGYVTEGEKRIAAHFGVKHEGRAADDWLKETVHLAWQAKMFVRLHSELEMRLREMAEEEAIKVFGRNLEDLLLAAPAGPRVTMGLDPGYRTGVKVAVVDTTGKLLMTTTVYPHEPKKQWEQAIETLAELCRSFKVDLVSVGNGTASRETDKLISELIAKCPDLNLVKVLVSEAGASVYSASEVAAKEFPNLDVSLRGAVSIARRLQDPLAELVKIEPKSIGVGQYQHDVNQAHLSRALDAVVEDCVNAVGVDANTASIPLLARVSGLNRGLAETIVAFRDENGKFISRQQFLQIARFGEKTFEQAAGFLRVNAGENPLDASAVHPEAYPIVQKIVEITGRPVDQMIGDSTFLRQLSPAGFIDERFGEPTVRDILRELEKPGRDPRPRFKTATFKEGVNEVSDLQAGMVLEGVVTNVTNFGAFVDVGVHQDGLVHVSQLSHRFVKDPHAVVKAGDIVEVKVLEVDEKRKRISLTMRTTPPPPRPKPRPRPKPKERKETPVQAQREKAAEETPPAQRPPRPAPRGPRPDNRPRPHPAQQQVRQQAAEKKPERVETKTERKPDKKPEGPVPQTAMAAAFAKVGVFSSGRKPEE